MRHKIKDRCGECEHTNNNLGLVALHCDILREKQLKEKDDMPDGKVRSSDKCYFSPSKWKKR